MLYGSEGWPLNKNTEDNFTPLNAEIGLCLDAAGQGQKQGRQVGNADCRDPVEEQIGCKGRFQFKVFGCSISFPSLACFAYPFIAFTGRLRQDKDKFVPTNALTDEQKTKGSFNTVTMYLPYGVAFEMSENAQPAEFEGVDKALKSALKGKDYEETRRILYGRAYPELPIPEEAKQRAADGNFELQGYQVTAEPEQLRPPRIVRVAVIQNAIVLPTTAPVDEQKKALHYKIGLMIEAAAMAGANIVCLQETWMMPFAFCTRERLPWTEFAESAEHGPTTKFLSEQISVENHVIAARLTQPIPWKPEQYPLAAKYGMVIINPILERDESKDDVIWNAAVIISQTGRIIGKTRKNHIPRVGDFNEGLSRTRDGVLIAEVDLNLCRQTKDAWGFRMTNRLDLYAKSFEKAAHPYYQPDIRKET
ncbi:hydrolase, carbon-nitrogen family [Teladorsagia circumcincta]|uniref:Hydrolase, carbon-nitrogen family n=1 Tax=Teladorsagia circumcincta TaxID=45464 RepID=A0A2G9UK89_TELCI|nr:hydrolase, carbon-nitrogen family [Teladorsagia circumcincta]